MDEQEYDRILATHALDRHANDALRIAWLTVHAERMYEVDPTGQTSAALLDLRDLLEGKAA